MGEVGRRDLRRPPCVFLVLLHTALILLEVCQGIQHANGAGALAFSCSVGSVSLTVDAQDLSYALWVTDAAGTSHAWLQGGDYALSQAGIWFSLSGGTLRVLGSSTSSGSDGLLGPFTAFTVAFGAGQGLLANATFRCYSASSAQPGVVFELEYVSGWTNVTTEWYPPPGGLNHTGEFNASQTPSAHFPSFAADGASPLAQLGYYEWAGRFSCDHSNGGVGLSGFVGGQTGGPLLLHNVTLDPATNKPVAAVLGPLDHFRSQILATVQARGWGGQGAGRRLVAGVQGWVVDIPDGFCSKTILVGSTKGINDAVYAYGNALQVAWRTERPRTAQGDPLKYKMSYWTDNGAYYSVWYWRWRWRPGDPTANDVMAAVKRYHESLDLTFGSYQIDPWWITNGPTGNPSNWSANATILPEGMRALDLPLVVYSSYFATPAEGNIMARFNWTASRLINNSDFKGRMAHVAVEDSRRFYEWAMDAGLSWGMVGFEVDVLDFSLLYDDFANSTDAYERWLGGIDAAGRPRNVTTQICMNLPSDALLSTQLHSLTNGRASEDNFPYADYRWNIAATSLLYGALDLAPFYDDVWTTGTQPGNPYGPGTNYFVELSMLISVLSSGPVGISDGIGYTNTTLVRAAAAPDATILKPSLPATPVDRVFLPPFSPAAIRGGCQIWATPSYIATPSSNASVPLPASSAASLGVMLPKRLRSGGPSSAFVSHYSILAIDVNTTVVLRPEDLTPPPPASTVTYLAAPWSPGLAAVAARCAPGQPALKGCVMPFARDAPLHIFTGGEKPNHAKPNELYSASPVWPNGFALVGEVAKVVRVSEQRITAVRADDAAYAKPNLVVDVLGHGTENIHLAFVNPQGFMAGASIAFEATKVQKATVVCSGVAVTACKVNGS